MASALLNVRVDEQLKLEAQKFAKKIGIPLSSLISGLLMKTVKTQKVSFETLTENGFTKEQEDQILAAKNSESYEFDSVKDAFAFFEKNEKDF